MADSSRWFKIVTFIGSGFILGVSIVNCVYYSRLSRPPIGSVACAGINSSQARTMFWINLIIAILAGIMFIWALVMLFTTSEQRTRSEDYLKDIPRRVATSAGATASDIRAAAAAAMARSRAEFQAAGAKFQQANDWLSRSGDIFGAGAPVLPRPAVPSSGLGQIPLDLPPIV